MPNLTEDGIVTFFVSFMAVWLALNLYDMWREK